MKNRTPQGVRGTKRTSAAGSRRFSGFKLDKYASKEGSVLLPDNSFTPALPRRFAGPVRSIFQVAGSLVFCKLWIRAQRTCETLCARSHHLIGSNTLFDPLLQCTDGVEGVDARSAAAMTHSWGHEKTHPVALILAHLVEDRV